MGTQFILVLVPILLIFCGCAGPATPPVALTEATTTYVNYTYGYSIAYPKPWFLRPTSEQYVWICAAEALEDGPFVTVFVDEQGAWQTASLESYVDWWVDWLDWQDPHFALIEKHPVTLGDGSQAWEIIYIAAPFARFEEGVKFKWQKKELFLVTEKVLVVATGWTRESWWERDIRLLDAIVYSLRPHP